MARIEPVVAVTIQERMKEENAHFFKAYHKRLVLIKQIKVLNQLMKEQHDLMKKAAPAARVPLAPIYPVMAQHQMEASGKPGMDMMGMMINAHVVNGINPAYAQGLFYPMHVDYNGSNNDVMMDDTTMPEATNDEQMLLFSNNCCWRH